MNLSIVMRLIYEELPPPPDIYIPIAIAIVIVAKMVRESIRFHVQIP